MQSWSMTVEESEKGSLIRRQCDGLNDQFPVGMRVLAVDDDPTCLMVLEALLLRCRYHVTVTNQATVALRLLRENRNKFDLVISDVHMPDLNGFKLLELIGLEMDLPVIMLSVNGETKTVMKGITQGACDYLLKPVRIEELKNIWQHVVRRRFGYKDHSSYNNAEDSEKHPTVPSEGGQGSGSTNYNETFSRKRKDQNEEDKDGFDDNMHENEDPTTQKKLRVVWSIDLHQKFVAAVNQLGIDKAVPKRILEIMNVDKLTRENVASHLQKYRIYLKRLSVVTGQQASMAAAFGSSDPSYLHMSSFDGCGSFHALAASGKLPAITLVQPSGVLGKVDARGSGLHSTSSIIVQVGHNNTSISTDDLNKLQQINFPANQHGRLLEGIPTAFKLEEPQPKRFHEANSCYLSDFSGSGLSTGSPSSSFLNGTNSTLVLQTHHQMTHSRGFVSHPSIRSLSVSSDPSVEISSHLADFGRCKGTWRCGVPLTGFTTNTLSIDSLANDDDLVKLTGNCPMSQRDNIPQSVSLTSTVMSPPVYPLIGRDSQCQSSSSGGQTILMPTNTDQESIFVNFSGVEKSKRRLEPKEDHISKHNILFNSFASSSVIIDNMKSPVSGNHRVNDSNQNGRMDINIVSYKNASSLVQQNYKIGTLTVDGLQKDENNFEITKLQGGVLSGCSLDVLDGSVIKPESHDHYHVSFMDNDTASDLHPLGACM